jgi:hypothetical protein
MRIESIIRRNGGTRITLEKSNYHFKPTADDARHIADVSNSGHAQHFLSIKEGYRIADGKVPAAAAATKSAATKPAETKKPVEPVKPTEPVVPVTPVEPTETETEAEQTGEGEGSGQSGDATAAQVDKSGWHVDRQGEKGKWFVKQGKAYKSKGFDTEAEANAKLVELTKPKAE